ncbi:cytochrome-c oxidase, cbb3-type subunit II [Thermithiobacillus tepidarius DSM 3134]|nr:cytochrome-c oxidase, cbb3-type subunit II [Thermithiobacillus tepidarius]
MKHETIETNIGLMLVLVMIVISIGGLVEIVPLFFIDKTIEKVDGVRPYTPLELAGRDIYQRESCFYCHSQMIRPFRDEAMRYGHYSLAAESMYDHPFQWGSKRTGPDLARVGGKYSNEWHVAHLIAPRDVVPESVMPNYPWLMQDNLKYDDIGAHMAALKKTGVPYSSNEAEFIDNIANFGAATALKLRINGKDYRGAEVDAFLNGLNAQLDQVINRASRTVDGKPALVFSSSKVVREADIPAYVQNVKADAANVLNGLVKADANGQKTLHLPSAKENLLAEAEANYDGDPKRLTEMDAVVAYLQMLGTLVDFKKYDEGYLSQFR